MVQPFNLGAEVGGHSCLTSKRDFYLQIPKHAKAHKHIIFFLGTMQYDFKLDL